MRPVCSQGMPVGFGGWEGSLERKIYGIHGNGEGGREATAAGVLAELEIRLRTGFEQRGRGGILQLAYLLPGSSLCARFLFTNPSFLQVTQIF